MQTGICELLIDSNGQEIVEHGTLLFPCARYHCMFNEFLNHEIPWHWHEEIEVMVVKCGVMKLQLNSETFLLEPGQGIFINSNVLHSATTVGEEECKIDSFVFHTKLLSGAMEEGFNQRFINPLTHNERLFGILFDGLEEWHNETLEHIRKAFLAYDEGFYCYELLVREHLSHMWYLLMKKLRSQISDVRKKEGQDVDRLKEMLQYIHLHFKENITVEQIAKVVSISERECLRCFQKTIGCPPIQYLLKYRISISAQLLITKEIPIIKIGEETGFESPSYFSKTFKRFMACSPSEYRKINEMII